MSVSYKNVPVIEKGIPLTPVSGLGYRALFRKMEPGDSVFFECDNPDRVRSAITGSLTQLKLDEKITFATRKVEGGLRVWRTE